MQLVVMSYPKHYHITQLAVQHALKYIPNIERIFVVWDDTHEINPKIPLRTVLRKKFNLTECPEISWSQLIPRIESKMKIKGNVGQQIIKLHLDLMINDDFIILDGDTIINHPIDPANVLYSHRLPFGHARYNLINHALGIPNYEYFSNTFMYVKNHWLSDLRIHVKAVTGKCIADLFEYDNRLIPIYEWELIASYILNVLKISKKIEYYDKAYVSTNLFEYNYNFGTNIVLNGTDDFSPNFMEKHGITVDKELMKQLNYTHA